MKIVVFGTSDTASLANFYFRYEASRIIDLHMTGGRTPAAVVAFTVDGKYLTDTQFEGKPVVPFEEIEKHYPPHEYTLFCPILDNKLRAQKYAEGLAKNYNFASYVSSKATMFSVVGRNCFIMENNVVQPYVRVGDNVIMWSGNHIGHHSTIEDDVFIASHVVIAGHCTIGKGAYLGVNSTIKDNTKIAPESFICMASAITQDTEAGKKYFGVPGKEK